MRVERQGVGPNVAANLANVAVVVGVSLVATPLLVDRLGLGGFGLWTLAQTLVIYVTTLDLGFGPAVARFTSVRSVRRELLPQLFFAALGLYLAFGLTVLAVCALAAEPIVNAFDVPSHVHADAVAAVRLMGVVALAALMAGAFDHMLVGLERFRASAATNAIGALIFLGVMFLAMRDDATLVTVAGAALAQWTTVAVLRLALLADVARIRGRRVPERGLLRDLAGFSARLQVAVLATLVNTQTDRVVIGLISTPAMLGQASIATQVADAARFLGYAAFTPMFSRMSRSYALDGEARLDELLLRYRKVWRPAVLGLAAISIGLIGPWIDVWLGAGHDEAALFAAVLLAGYAISLLPLPEFARRRALGIPGLEGRFGLMTVGANLALTAALAPLLGARGVIAATALAYTLGTAWAFAKLPERQLGGAQGEIRQLLASLLVAAAAAAITHEVAEALVVDLSRVSAMAAIVVLGLTAVGILALAVARAGARWSAGSDEAPARPALSSIAERGPTA